MHASRCPALALVAAGFIASHGIAQRVPDTQINSSATPRASQPDIQAVGGIIYATWSDHRNGEPDIYFDRSLDGGQTWSSSDTRIDTGSAAGVAWSADPKIQVSGSVVVICWQDFREGVFPHYAGIYCNRSLDGGLTWLPNDVRVIAGFAPGQSTTISHTLSCINNDVFVTWEDLRDGNRDVYFQHSVDAGLTWLANDVRIDTGDPAGAANSTLPRHVVSGNDIHVIWADFRNSNFSGDIYYNHSLDAGATWLPSAIRIDHSPNVTFQGAIFPRIAVAGSSVYVMWHDNPYDPNFQLLSRDVFFNRSLDRGLTWLPTDVRLNTSGPAGTFFTEFPDLCASGDEVFAVWIDRRQPRTVAFNRSLDSGTTWLATDVPLGSPPTNSFTNVDVPRIAASGPLLLATWADDRDGDFDIYANSSSDSGTTWLQQEQRLDTGSPAGDTNSYLPVPALDGTSPYVAWEDQRGGATDVFFNLPFGHLPYGSGLAGSGGFVPQLNGQGLAKSGETCTYPINDALGGAPAALVLGLQKANAPVLGGTLLVDPIVIDSLILGGASGVPGAGIQNPTIALPNSPAFIGFSIFSQLLVLDPAAPGGLAMSAGIELWIG